VPLGHALYYLSMAKVYDEWINKVTKLREEMREYEEMVSRIRREKVSEQDEILQELLYIKDRINTSAGILTDKARTAFFFVVIPEAGALDDTQKAARLFAQFDVPVAGYVVNRVIPRELLAQNIPEYLRHRIAMQDQHLRGLQSAFGDRVLARAPEMERDVTGLPMIEKLANIMFA
jgi:arsenite-transporting ATPase